MSTGKLVAERATRDPERLARYYKLIVHGRPADAQRAVEIEAEEEATRGGSAPHAFTREVGA